MTFSQIAASLGIEKYPEEMDRIYRQVQAGAPPLFDEALIHRYHRELNLFGEHYEAVLAGYQDLLTKPEAYLYAQVIAYFLQNGTYAQAQTIPLPEPDGSPALDMLPLLAEMTMVDHGIDAMQTRGVSRELATERLVQTFRGDIAVNVRRHGRPGLDRLYFLWITNYIYAMIFHCDGFLFNISTLGKGVYVLRNKKDGAAVVLLHERQIHRCGKILGSAGLEEEEGSFFSTVTEKAEGWFGYPADPEGLIHDHRRFFSREDWELAVKSGDSCLNIHLPAGVGLEKEATREAIRKAFRYAEEFYSDYAVKALHCVSWLLNPELKEILGPNSNILAFGELFHLHPVKCPGISVFNFVFRTSVNPDPATLPEDNRLQRWLKAKYLAGGYHHNFGGFILPEDMK